MERLVESELLDHLPPSDPRAVRSRSDLRRLNEWMRNPRIIASELRRHSPRTVLEIGAGDGNLMLRVAELSGLRGVAITLLDRQACFAPGLRETFAALDWKLDLIQSDVLEFLSRPDRRFHFVLCNLFLHHFNDSTLQEMFRSVKSIADNFLASEPRRARRSLLIAKLLWMIRCNAVTRHDAVISVRAGFTGSEIGVLWGQTPDWRIIERRMGPFSHFFKAERVSAKEPETQ